MVANDPWQKSGRILTPAADRLAMVEAGIAGAEGVEASAIEIGRGGPSYTADTLEQLAAEDERRELFLVVGADVAADLGTWRRPDVVARLAVEAALTQRARAGDRPPEPQELGPADLPGGRDARLPEGRAVLVTGLRARAAAGRPLDHLTPAPVLDWIRARGLYRWDR